MDQEPKSEADLYEEMMVAFLKEVQEGEYISNETIAEADRSMEAYAAFFTHDLTSKARKGDLGHIVGNLRMLQSYVDEYHEITPERYTKYLQRSYTKIIAMYRKEGDYDFTKKLLGAASEDGIEILEEEVLAEIHELNRLENEENQNV